MPEDRPVDPRFDPRYQRGFDPATMPVDPASLHAPVDDHAPVPPASPVPAAMKHESDELGAPNHDGDELEPVSARNPFRLGLLLVSVGLLVLAAATLWWTANNQNAFLFGSSDMTAQGWMFQELTGILPTAAIPAGFVGLVIWLGLGALDAKAKVQDRPEHPHGE